MKLSTVRHSIVAEMQRQSIELVSEESKDHNITFRLDWSVSLELKVEWKGQGTLSYQSNNIVVAVLSSPIRARRRTRVFRQTGGTWPVERIVRTVSEFQKNNRRLAEEDSKLRDRREQMAALSRKELPRVPSGIHLMRLHNGHYRISITELTLPLEPTKRLINIVNENRAK